MNAYYKEFIECISEEIRKAASISVNIQNMIDMHNRIWMEDTVRHILREQGMEASAEKFEMLVQRGLERIEKGTL